MAGSSVRETREGKFTNQVVVGRHVIRADEPILQSWTQGCRPTICCAPRLVRAAPR